MTEPSPGGPDAAPPPLLRLWWRAMEVRIGIVPAPLALAVVAIAAVYVQLGQAPADILMNIAILAAGGFACGEIGKRIPGLRHLGLAAILATFVPSYLVYAHLLPGPIVKSIGDFTEQSNFLYLFVGSIVVGSILGMDRRLLELSYELEQAHSWARIQDAVQPTL